jgi:hypothetical protein
MSRVRSARLRPVPSPGVDRGVIKRGWPPPSGLSTAGSSPSICRSAGSRALDRSAEGLAVAHSAAEAASLTVSDRRMASTRDAPRYSPYPYLVSQVELPALRTSAR